MLNQIAAAGIIVFSIIMAADSRNKTMDTRFKQIIGGLAIAAVVML